jgi:hypothetical protein
LAVKRVPLFSGQERTLEDGVAAGVTAEGFVVKAEDLLCVVLLALVFVVFDVEVLVVGGLVVDVLLTLVLLLGVVLTLVDLEEVLCVFVVFMVEGLEVDDVLEAELEELGRVEVENVVELDVDDLENEVELDELAVEVEVEVVEDVEVVLVLTVTGGKTELPMTLLLAVEGGSTELVGAGVSLHASPAHLGPPTVRLSKTGFGSARRPDWLTESSGVTSSYANA